MADRRSGTRRTPATEVDARERILAAAYELFCSQGIRAVGIETVLARADVAKATLYRHFASKDDLVLAVLDRREERWTVGWLADSVRQRADDPAEALLAIFDVFDGWFRRRSYGGCLFVTTLLEVSHRSHPVHLASRDHLTRIRRFVAGLAADAGLADPDAFARQWHILMKGSIVAASEGDAEAA